MNARRGYRYPFKRESGHRCHKRTCDRFVPASMLACKPHWYELPQELRTEIWRTYRKGQEVDKRPSAEYLEAARRCQEFWETTPEARQGELL